MPTQDALTGLLTAHLFQDRLRQTVGRSLRYKEPSAVVYIKLANYNYIKKTWGVAVAEQSLLRSVIKLRRILRDVDTVGRIDDAIVRAVIGAMPRRPTTCFVCGNNSFVGTVADALVDVGIDAKDVKTERYGG